MPIYDHLCNECGNTFESIQPVSVEQIKCSCGGIANRVISCGSCYTSNEDADWIKTVREVINRDTQNKVAQEFLRNPTRSNYKAWMKSEGIRPLERNEPIKPKAPNINPIRREVWEKFKKRHRVEI